jgi:hypothetical protein
MGQLVERLTSVIENSLSSDEDSQSGFSKTIEETNKSILAQNK